MRFADVEQLDTHVLTEVGLIDQQFRPAPRGFDALEIRVMHDGVELATDLRIE
ncbi:hypothetical protein D3C75_1364450 [compost metagenome]